MKKNFLLFTLFAAVLAITTTSCTSGKSYKDSLKAQTKNIDRFVKDNNFEILNEFPKDSIFGEKQFYRDSESGVYIRIDSYGDKSKLAKKEKPNAQVLIRPYTFHVLSDSAALTYPQSADPIKLYYGIASTYVYGGSDQGYPYFCLSRAMVLPLPYVGEGGIVSAIVPFTYGSKYQTSAYEPMYIQFKYTKFIQ